MGRAGAVSEAPLPGGGCSALGRHSGNVARKPLASIVGDLLLGHRLRVDEDVDHSPAHEQLAVALLLERCRHRRGAELGDGHLHVQQVVEAGRAVEGRLRVSHDHVAAGRNHRFIGAERLAPELRERDVEEREVVRVEDDALRVALVVAHAQLMDERRGQASWYSPNSSRMTPQTSPIVAFPLSAARIGTSRFPSPRATARSSSSFFWRSSWSRFSLNFVSRSTCSSSDFGSTRRMSTSSWVSVTYLLTPTTMSWPFS